MSARRAVAGVSLAVLAIGTWTTLRYGLRHASEQHSGEAFAWWTFTANPALGAMALWLGRPALAAARHRKARVVARLLIGAAAGIALGEVLGYFTSLNVSCYDPNDSGECGFGLFVIDALAAVVAIVLALTGLVLKAIARSRAD